MKHILWVLLTTTLFFCTTTSYEQQTALLQNEIQACSASGKPAAPVFHRASSLVDELTNQGKENLAEDLAITMIEHFSYTEIGRNSIQDLEPVLKLYDKMNPKHKACVNKYMGRIHRTRSEYEQALSYLEESLKQYTALNLPNAVDLHIDLGNLHAEANQNRQAEVCFQNAIDEANRLNNPGKLGRALFTKGRFISGQNPVLAMDLYRQALPYLKEKHSFLYPHCLRNLAGLQMTTGNPDEALQTLFQTAEAYKGLNNPANEAMIFIEMGDIHALFGERQLAFDHYHKAEEALKNLKNPGYYQALVHNSKGNLYHKLGEYSQSWPELEQSLSWFEANQPKSPLMVVNQMAAGDHFLAMDETERALSYYYQALNSAGNEKNIRLSRIFFRLGKALSKQGDTEEALCFFHQALDLQEDLKLATQQADTLLSLSRAYHKKGQLQKAEQCARNALSLHRATGSKEEEAFSLHQLARVQEAQGQLNQSLDTLDQGINILETLRSDLIGRHFRTSYFASIREIYLAKIALLVKLSKEQKNNEFAAAAFETSEKARARTLLDILEETREDNANRDEPLRKLAAFRKKLLSKTRQIMTLREDGEARESWLSLDREIEDLVAQYRESEAEFHTKAPHPNLSNPTSLRQIQKGMLDGETVLLEYALGRDQSYLWLISRHALETVLLPGEAEIEEKAQTVYSLLNARNESLAFETSIEKQSRIEKADRDFPKAALELSRILLGDILPKIKNKRLLLVCDGALLLTPFNALPYPNQPETPVLDHHEVIQAPSASVLYHLQKAAPKHHDKTLAIFADPVFSAGDIRIKEPVPNGGVAAWNTRSSNLFKLPRLPYTRTEAHAITDLLDKDQYIEALDYDANLQNFRNFDLQRCHIIHLATHGYVDPRWPELSGLMFSRVDSEGKSREWMLTLSEVFSLRLNADLVVLSACRTAMGREFKGEGLIGLSYGFMNAGAGSVVASLWNIQDETTAKLMGLFYKNLLHKKQPPAQALREAQQSLRQDPERQSPYFWSAFTYQGPWDVAGTDL